MREVTERLPSGAARIANRHPEIWAAYQTLGAACADAGPLDARTRRLAKARSIPTAGEAPMTA
jgi:hypothetical protein